MKTFTEYLYFHTKNKIEFINITDKVQECVYNSNIKEGLCLVNAMHITASIFINDDEQGLHKDLVNGLRDWRHMHRYRNTAII